MKRKIYIMISMILLLICFGTCVYADGMGPAINYYHAKVTPQDGASYYAYGEYHDYKTDTYEDYEELTYKGKLDAGTRIKVFWESEINGKNYIYFTENITKNLWWSNDNFDCYYMDRDDVSLVSEDFEIYWDTTYFVKIINKDGIKIYEGPSTYYDVVGTLEFNDKGIECYVEYDSEQWYYIEYNGLKGWFDHKGGETLISYTKEDDISDYKKEGLSIEPIKIYKAVPFVEENVIYTIPKGTWFNVQYSKYSPLTYYGGYTTDYYYFTGLDMFGIIDYTTNYITSESAQKCKVLDKNGLKVYKSFKQFEEPNADYEVVGILPFGTEFECHDVYNFDGNQGYCYICNDNIEGYIWERDNFLLLDRLNSVEKKSVKLMKDLKLYDAFPLTSENLRETLKEGIEIDLDICNVFYNYEYKFVNSGICVNNELDYAIKVEENTKVVLPTIIYEKNDFNSKVIKDDSMPIGASFEVKYAERAYLMNNSYFAGVGWLYGEFDGVKGWIYTFPAKYFAQEYTKVLDDTYSWYTEKNLKSEISNFLITCNSYNSDENVNVVYQRLVDNYNGLSIEEKEEIIEIVEQIKEEEINNVETNKPTPIETPIKTPSVTETSLFDNIPPQELVIVCISVGVVLTLTAIVIIALINRDYKIKENKEDEKNEN